MKDDPGPTRVGGHLISTLHAYPKSDLATRAYCPSKRQAPAGWLGTNFLWRKGRSTVRVPPLGSRYVVRLQGISVLVLEVESLAGDTFGIPSPPHRSYHAPRLEAPGSRGGYKLRGNSSKARAKTTSQKWKRPWGPQRTSNSHPQNQRPVQLTIPSSHPLQIPCS